MDTRKKKKETRKRTKIFILKLSMVEVKEVTTTKKKKMGQRMHN
jgi:hypothetical protein